MRLLKYTQTYFLARTPALALFALLSCVAHAGLLYVMSSSSGQPRLPLASQPLQLALLLPAEPAIEPASNSSATSPSSTQSGHPISHSTPVESRTQPNIDPIPSKSITIKVSASKSVTSAFSHTDLATAPEDVSASASTPDPISIETPTAIPAATTQIADAAHSASSLQAQLELQLVSYFHYPRLAQRHNWQGLVELAVRVEADGLLSHIRVIKSSGHSILDNAAMNSLKQIATIPNATAWLQGNYYDTTLPVHYKLTDS